MTLPQSPAALRRMMEVLDSGHLHQFPAALRNMPPATEDDAWPREALDWLITYPRIDDESRDLQIQCVSELASGFISPLPGKDWRYLEKALYIDALHLWDPLVEAGFSANRETLMGSLLGYFKASPLPIERRAQWLEKLLKSDFAPDVSSTHDSGTFVGPRTALEYVVVNSKFAFIPLLHKAGHVLPATKDYRFLMADYMAAGKWLYPDLLMPDVLFHRDAIEYFSKRLSDGAFSQLYFLKDPVNVQKFCQLPVEDTSALRSLFMSILEDKTWDDRDSAHFQAPITAATVECLILLHDHGLLDLPSLLANPDLPRSTAPLVESTRFEFDARQLKEETPKAVPKSRTAQRL